MTLMECHQKYHNMIMWIAASIQAQFPEQYISDLAHAGYLHIARYIDANLDENYKESSTVYNLARWGMLKEALKEAKWRKRCQRISDYSGYDAVPRLRYIPASERMKRSLVCSRDPVASIWADEIIEKLCHEERMLILGISVYGITAQEIAEENDVTNIAVLNAYHDVIKKVRQRLSRPNVRCREPRAAWHKWFHGYERANPQTP